MIQLLRYEKELIKAREIIPTVEKHETSPIETFEEFKNRQEMSTLAK